MIVTFSSSSHSGKTTFAEHIQKLLGKDNVIIYNEIIRRYDIKSIDDLRRDPNRYFKIQKEIITEKYDQEICARKDHQFQLGTKNKIIIFDRSLADSFYYYTKYVKVNLLSDENKKEFYEFQDKVYRWAADSFEYVYDRIILFNPIPLPEKLNDGFREKGLREKQMSEFHMIKLYSYGFCKDWNKIKFIDVKRDNSLMNFMRLLYETNNS